MKLESIYKNDIIPNSDENAEKKNGRGSQYTMVTYVEYKGNGSVSRLVETVIQNSLRRPLNVGGASGWKFEECKLVAGQNRGQLLERLSTDIFFRQTWFLEQLDVPHEEKATEMRKTG